MNQYNNRKIFKTKLALFRIPEVNYLDIYRI